MAILSVLSAAGMPAEAYAGAASAAGSVLQLCPAPQGAAAQDGVLTHPDGRLLQVQLRAASAALPSCGSLSLPVAPAAITAIHALTPAQAASLAGTLLVQMDAGGERIAAVESAAEAPPQGRQAMPVQENLLPLLTVRPYGVEERIAAELKDGRLRIDCRAGAKPAGLLLAGPWHLPAAAMRLRFAVSQPSPMGAAFVLGVADAARAAREDAAVIGVLANETSFALPARLDGASWQHFSIACPEQAAQLELASLSLQPMSGKAAGRSAWVWQARQWMEEGDSVLAWAARHGLRTLFLSVPLTAAADGMAVAQPERLAAFARRAAAQGIALWPVDGDPRMVLENEQPATSARLRAYAAYNVAADAPARLHGVQFDIEHYLLPGYERAAAELDRAYLLLLRGLWREAGGLALEFVVPFWWSGKSALLEGLAEHASGVAVMDYRTDPAQIRRFAQPFLDWGVAHKKQVRIALEAGYLPPELQRRYARADAGEAWLVQLDGVPLLVLLKTVQANPHGASFRLQSERVLDGSATTFHADPAALLRLLPALEADFSAWSSFNGIALHELK
ncbi:hypothetical protein [Massilia sp. erpn]|uniref:hypothetical protein n=1 Tax=Massilia sp. erpn TaxID=2738142 RepID=UPI002108207D|nr:hypothetical protein [Massilia sp. erpn]UTY60032.1 hypothetical protein HPQ68_24275 [Massilia sp. erpn]